MDPRSALKPASFRRLVLTGFSLVSLPLLLALLYAGVSVGRLETQSRRALLVAASAARNGRALVDQVRDLERQARQHVVLGDAQSLQAFSDREASARQTLAELAALGLPPEQMRSVRAAEAALASVAAAVRGGGGPAVAAGTADPFARLDALSKDVLAAGTRWASGEADALREKAGRVKTVLLWLAAAVIPATAALVAFFSLLIFRPVREIHLAIRRLGSGDFATGVAIHGPRDLELVGERLEWLRRRLLDARQQRHKLLAHASHDLKTPLAAIREGAELLLEQDVGTLTPEQEEVAQILRQSSVRLQRSLQALLDVNVAAAREVAARPEGISLSAVVERVLADHRPTLIKKEIALDARLEEGVVRADAERLRTVIDNLLSNAVKFTPEGGTIELTVRRLADAVAMDVRDSGPGVAAEDRDRVFEAFYEGRHRPGGGIRGSGLGLSIAREYTEIDGGTLQLLESGSGAHFRVAYPIAAQRGGV